MTWVLQGILLFLGHVLIVAFGVSLLCGDVVEVFLHLAQVHVVGILLGVFHFCQILVKLLFTLHLGLLV